MKNILSKNGNSKILTLDDIFSLNLQFKSNNRRIKIPNLVFKIENKERQEIDQTNLQNRKYQMDASIVRIMKSRKYLEHTQLINETLKQLNFAPEPKMIKQRIEDLIERDYLERVIVMIQNHTHHDEEYHQNQNHDGLDNNIQYTTNTNTGSSGNSELPNQTFYKYKA